MSDGTCAAELQAAKDALAAARTANDAVSHAEWNTNAGGLATAAGWVVAGACVVGGAASFGTVTAGCIAGGGLTAISGVLWTGSGLGTEGAARDDLGSKIDALDAAVDNLCNCLDENFS